MNYKLFIGIDVSKEKIDVWIHPTKKHEIFENQESGFKKMINWITKITEHKNQLWLFCFEHTGLYSLPLSLFLTEQNIHFVLSPALEIKRSLGITRGKSDLIDAQKIAEYAYLKREELKPTILPGKPLIKLQQLISLRERLVRQRAGFITSAKEYKSMLKETDNSQLFETHRNMIENLSKEIETLEQSIRDTIKEDEIMAKQFGLLTSIKGIGLIVAAYLIMSTHCFQRFETWRQYACYAGIAPFEYSSGSSIRGKTRVSHLANKQIKALLHLAASTAILHDPELKEYYQKRVEQKKSKMSTLNIVRNKLISRAFAVVKRETPYVNIKKYSA